MSVSGPQTSGLDETVGIRTDPAAQAVLAEVARHTAWARLRREAGHAGGEVCDELVARLDGMQACPLGRCQHRADQHQPDRPGGKPRCRAGNCGCGGPLPGNAVH